MLTERRLDVLELMAAGLTMPQIARELFITVDTVKTHQRHIYRALGVPSAAAAVAAGFRLDLLTAEPRRFPPHLSPRELEIVRMAAAGHAQKATAERLGISPLTVKSHYGRIMRRLKARTAAQVVAICCGTGLLP